MSISKITETDQLSGAPASAHTRSVRSDQEAAEACLSPLDFAAGACITPAWSRVCRGSAILRLPIGSRVFSCSLMAMRPERAPMILPYQSGPAPARASGRPRLAFPIYIHPSGGSPRARRRRPQRRRSRWRARKQVAQGACICSGLHPSLRLSAISYLASPSTSARGSDPTSANALLEDGRRSHPRAPLFLILAH